MKRRIVWLILSFLMVLSLVLASCSTKTTSTTTPTTTPTSTSVATTKPTTTATTAPTTTTGNWWDGFGTPKYGGTITMRLNQDPGNFDPWLGLSGSSLPISFFLESLAQPDWAVDRKIYAQNSNYRPVQYMAGVLAESWEQPDTSTVIFHIRKGIRWQDKPPLNGRELTAYDVEFHWQRQLGLGSGYTKASPYFGGFEIVKSVTATDKYTLVFKSIEPQIGMLATLIGTLIYGQVVPREVVQQYTIMDWKHALGTGPFILDDYVSGSAISFSKNPGYWAYDQRYQQNQLPYSNAVKLLVIPDNATALAALRTGKIDFNANVAWQQAANLKRTNTTLIQLAVPGSAYGLRLRVDRKPFTDIKVRKAMQMAIDLDTIAKTYYGGVVDGTPIGQEAPAMGEFYTPFNEWPKTLQSEYTYNPNGAKQLLVDAGYSTGFKTNIVASSSDDIDLLQVVKSYLYDIGVDMEIRVMDPASWKAFCNAGKHDQMVYWTTNAYSSDPKKNLQYRSMQQPTNYTFNNDPVYEDIYNKFVVSINADEQRSLVKQADLYAQAQHWTVNFIPAPAFTIFQPWLKGYSGESKSDC